VQPHNGTGYARTWSSFDLPFTVSSSSVFFEFPATSTTLPFFAKYRLNVAVVMDLTDAIVPAFLKRGNFTLINMGSRVAVAPEVRHGVYVAEVCRGRFGAFARSSERQELLPGVWCGEPPIGVPVEMEVTFEVSL
jgi:hypothetical protein